MTSGFAPPRLDTTAVDLNRDDIDPAAVLHSMLHQAAAGVPTAIGYPGAVDIDYTTVLPLFGRLFNNLGDPSTPPGDAANTTMLERAVVDWCADLLALPALDRWGYVTAGGTEGNLAAIHAAHHRYPDAVAYHSRAAHYSIGKVLGIVGIDTVPVGADDRGEMDYHHLDEALAQHPGRPAIVIATAGTTMTEAVDDTARIRAVLDRHGVAARHVHVDAALAGVPLALDGTLRFDPAGAVASVTFSGHKFFGTPIPCGVVLMRDSTRKQGQHIAYTATLDSTVSGSRCGQAAALLWYAIATYGARGHRYRAVQARELAAYTAARLTAIGWPAWRHPHAFTVVLRTPPAEVTRKWLLATDGDWSHTLCMPGITHAQMDAFISDVAAAAVSGSRPARLPAQREPGSSPAA